jgi:hypothetical protein
VNATKETRRTNDGKEEGSQEGSEEVVQEEGREEEVTAWANFAISMRGGRERGRLFCLGMLEFTLQRAPLREVPCTGFEGGACRPQPSAAA